MSFKYNRQIVVYALIIGIVVVGIALCVSGCGEFFYTRTVHGQVASSGSRWRGGSEKIALKLGSYIADSEVRATSAGGNALLVECTSSRCAALEHGECVDLTCKIDRRIFEPSVVVCKMKRSVDCR